MDIQLFKKDDILKSNLRTDDYPLYVKVTEDCTEDSIFLEAEIVLNFSIKDYFGNMVNLDEDDKVGHWDEWNFINMTGHTIWSKVTQEEFDSASKEFEKLQESYELEQNNNKIIKTMKQPTYNLNFYEALKLMFEEDSWIKGENFHDGYYLKCDDDGNILLVDVGRCSMSQPYKIHASLRHQKYRLITVATMKELSK